MTDHPFLTRVAEIEADRPGDRLAAFAKAAREDYRALADYLGKEHQLTGKGLIAAVDAWTAYRAGEEFGASHPYMKLARHLAETELKGDFAAASARIAEEEPQIAENFREFIRTQGFSAPLPDDPRAELASARSAPRLVQARLGEPMLVEVSSNTLPTEIQWMPPGNHTITPFVAGESQEISIHVDAKLAEKFNALLQQLIATARAGQGDEPFFDFNHDDREASGHPYELFWGGNDPRSGGIRAKVKWTSAGEAAIKGRTYTRFSPQWAISAKSRQPVGITVNLGGLVNRAAFKSIQPVAAKGSLTFPESPDEHTFIVAAREFAKGNNIADEQEAQVRFASTKAGREAYANYCVSLASCY